MEEVSEDSQRYVKSFMKVRETVMPIRFGIDFNFDRHLLQKIAMLTIENSVTTLTGAHNSTYIQLQVNIAEKNMDFHVLCLLTNR